MQSKGTFVLVYINFSTQPQFQVHFLLVVTQYRGKKCATGWHLTLVFNTKIIFQFSGAIFINRKPLQHVPRDSSFTYTCTYVCVYAFVYWIVSNLILFSSFSKYIHICIYVCTYFFLSAFIRPAIAATHLLLTLSSCPYATNTTSTIGEQQRLIHSPLFVCVCTYVVVCSPECALLYFTYRATASTLGPSVCPCSCILSISTTVKALWHASKQLQAMREQTHEIMFACVCVLWGRS